MQSAIVQMILIVVGIAAAAIVSIIVYAQLSSNAPDDGDNIDYARINTQTLCEAVGGTWTRSCKHLRRVAMVSSLVVLRTSVLLMLLLATITGLYVRHVTRLSADAAAQSAASAAASAATAAGWQCQTTPPAEAVDRRGPSGLGPDRPPLGAAGGRGGFRRRLQPDRRGHHRAVGYPDLVAAHHRHRLSLRSPHRSAGRAWLMLRPPP